MKMKPMVYKSIKEHQELIRSGKYREILYEGDYKNHHFVITSLITHPTAYVETLYLMDYDELQEKIKVHGGITYEGGALWNENDYRDYIGWDYAHGGDCFGDEIKGNKYTTEEIYEEVKSVIDQLIKLRG